MRKIINYHDEYELMVKYDTITIKIDEGHKNALKSFEVKTLTDIPTGEVINMSELPDTTQVILKAFTQMKLWLMLMGLEK